MKIRNESPSLCHNSENRNSIRWGGPERTIAIMALLLWSISAMGQTCPNGGSTSISGTVYAPNGTDPLPNILVYVPTQSPAAFTDGVNPSSPVLDNAATLVSGSPSAETTSASDGTFTLKNVPSGANVPLVIQAGRWRRQFVISSVTQCQANPLTTVTQGGSGSLSGYGESTSIRFAQNQGEGDIPKIALVTGGADALECTLRKTGIADEEFTDYTVNVPGADGSAPGRVNLFEGAGKSGAAAGSTTHTEDQLVGSSSSSFSGSLLGGYNVLMFPCQGTGTDYTTADGRSNAIAFTGAGGRIFATHYSGFYIDQDPSIDGAANWTSATTLPNGDATINTAFSSGSTLAQWLQGIGATTTLGQVELETNKNNQTGTNPPTQNWATLNSDSDVMQFSFFTPVGNTANNQYGRVLYDEYHVDDTTTTDAVTFPNECTGTMAKTSPMSGQEHMLEYSLFDLMNFQVPVISTNLSITFATNPTDFTGGDKADTIDITVTNEGAAAISTSPIVTIAVTIPAGLTAVALTDPSGNWDCNVTTRTCTLSNPLAASASNSVTLTASVAANVSTGTEPVVATVSSTGFYSSVTGTLMLNTEAAPPGTITGPTETSATSTNVGSTTTSAATATFAISAGTTINSILVVTEGFTGEDFTNAGSGTCSATTYATDTTCTVVVNFSPLYPGQRIGAVEILGNSNNLLDTAYISGIGIGPEAIFQPGTQAVVASGSGASSFEDAAVDVAGDVYLVDNVNNRILKETPAGNSYNQSILLTGLNGPSSIAIDGAGNLYIADATGDQVIEETLLGGTYTQSTVASGLSSPGGVAVDGSGNVYIADTGNNRILMETRSGGSYVQTTVAGGLGAPAHIALDENDDVYIADTGNSRVILETLSNGTYSQSVVASSLGAPSGIAVDGNGNIYIADTGNNRVIEEQLVSGSYVESQLVGGLNGPRAVAVDERGNLYIADYGDNTLYREDYSDPPSESFLNTAVNTVGSDSPKTVSLANFGNAALTVSAVTEPVDFPELTGNANDCSTSFSLAAATCNFRIDFDPQSTGVLSESLTLTDNNLNVASTNQTIGVSGTSTATFSISPSPASLSIPVIGAAYSQSLSASGGTGPYTYSVTSGSLPGGLTLSPAGVLSGTPTAAGTFTFTIQAKDSTGSGSGGPYTGSQSYTVTIAAPTIAVAPGTLGNGTVGSIYSQTVSASGGNGPYSYAVTNGSLPAGLSLNSSTGAVTGTPTSTGNASFMITATDTATTGTGAPYSGDRSYSITIGKGTATVTLGGLNQTYTGSPLSATATTAPSGLNVTFTYNGSPTAPTAVGSYAVVATINDSNYQGSATGTMIIAKVQPAITWATPSAIVYGTALSGVQLDASVTGIPGTFVYTPAAGTVLGAGANQTLSVTFTPTDTTDYGTSTQTVLITVAQLVPVVTLGTSMNPAMLQTPVTFTAIVSATAGTPTGSVNFLDGTTVLGSGTLTAGTATFTISSLTAGSHSISVVYSGDSNFAGSSSVVTAQAILDFSVNLVTPGGNVSSTTQTVAPGGSATDTVAIAPTTGTAFPLISYLTVTGLPAGGTATLHTPGWTQLTSTSWSVPAFAQLSDVSLTFQLPATTLAATGGEHRPLPHKFPPALAVLFLLPFARRLRREGKRLGAMVSIFILAMSAMALTGLSGCGSNNGFFAVKPTSYTITITVTTGTLSHSAQVTLESE